MKKILILATVFSVLIQIFLPGFVMADDIAEGRQSVDIEVAAESAAPPQVNAGAAILMDMKSGRVIYGKNAHKQVPIASTTKIMTGILAIEKGRLDDLVTVSKNAAGIWGSRMNLKEGEQFTLRELLYGLMLESGNDAALAIAEHIGGSVEGFLDMMNDKARELGAVNTHFTSPHGLDMPGHYSTAYDLAIITRYALRNPVFSKYVATKEMVISDKNLHNTNEMLELYPGADGVKTGYTGKAGRCLVSSATRNGWRVISVVLNCASRTARANSSKLLLDYAFHNFTPRTLMESGKSILRLPVPKGEDSSVLVEAMDDVVVPLSDAEMAMLETKLEVPDRLVPPVGKRIECGSLTFLLNGEVVGRSGLRTADSVERKDFLDYFGNIFDRWVRMFREGMFMEP